MLVLPAELHYLHAVQQQWELPAVALLSLQAQIQAGDNKPVQLLQYGPEGPVDPTKCTAVCFIPGSEGTVFAAAHLSGTVIIHIKVCLHVMASLQCNMLTALLL